MLNYFKESMPASQVNSAWPSLRR